jgi:hypothetical protein
MLLAAYLLFAHGCHGDEDSELFLKLGDRLSSWVAPSSDGP